MTSSSKDILKRRDPFHLATYLNMKQIHIFKDLKGYKYNYLQKEKREPNINMIKPWIEWTGWSCSNKWRYNDNSLISCDPTSKTMMLSEEILISMKCQMDLAHPGLRAGRSYSVVAEGVKTSHWSVGVLPPPECHWSWRALYICSFLELRSFSLVLSDEKALFQRISASLSKKNKT